MTRKRDLDAEFFDFHVENPRVYELLVRFAREAMRAGKTKVGINMLYTRVRWDVWLETRDRASPELKLNDGYTSRYARLIMANEPDLAGFFEIRRLRS